MDYIRRVEHIEVGFKTLAEAADAAARGGAPPDAHLTVQEGHDGPVVALEWYVTGTLPERR